MCRPTGPSKHRNPRTYFDDTAKHRRNEIPIHFLQLFIQYDAQWTPLVDFPEMSQILREMLVTLKNRRPMRSGATRGGSRPLLGCGLRRTQSSSKQTYRNLSLVDTMALPWIPHSSTGEVLLVSCQPAKRAGPRSTRPTRYRSTPLTSSRTTASNT